MNSQTNIEKRIGSSADYDANNSWYFNSGNGCLNNNNRYNGNFRSRPVLDYHRYDNDLLEEYPIPLYELLTISKDCAKNKSSKPSYVFYSADRIRRLVTICHEMNNSEVMPRESTAHIIFEPRVREIVCADFDKRILQAWYINQLKPILESKLYHPDSYSCRKGKGGLKAVQTLQEYVSHYSNDYTSDLWIAKVDIKAFFMNLDCFQVVRIFEKLIRDNYPEGDRKELLLYLTRIIYLQDTTGNLKDMARPEERSELEKGKSMYDLEPYRGVPIGDWTSQTAGLVITTYALNYLSSLGYAFIHYTDDTVVIVRDVAAWREDVDRLEKFYKDNFGLTLHKKKRYFQHYSKGVEALGYKVRFNRILPSDRIYHNLQWFVERSIRRANEAKSYAITHKEKVLATINSYLGFLKWCNGYNLRKEIVDRILESPFGLVFEAPEDYSKISIKKDFTKKAYYKNEYRKLKNNLNLLAI